MKVGIIGAGGMGGALGRLWVEAGHDVVLSFSRDKRKLREAVEAAGSGARAGSAAEAAAFGEDAVVLAVPWAAREAALSAAGDLGGRVLISSVMPLNRDKSGLEIAHTTSAAEEIAKLAPGARVVEAFNSVFAPLLSRKESREFDGHRPSVFLCGDDEGAKGTARRLISAAGLDPVDAGPLESARYLEPFGMLMVRLAYGQGKGADIAVRLLERAEASRSAPTG